MKAKTSDEPITYRHAFAWSVGMFIALLALAGAFYNTVVGRAEAAADRVEGRVYQRLDNIEKDVRDIHNYLIGPAKESK